MWSFQNPEKTVPSLVVLAETRFTTINISVATNYPTCNRDLRIIIIYLIDWNKPYFEVAVYLIKSTTQELIKNPFVF